MNTILVVLDAVVNSLWQAVAVAALVFIALKFLRTNAATRHAIWWATLAVVLILPAAPSAIREIAHVVRSQRTVPVTALTAPKLVAPRIEGEPVFLTITPARTAKWPLAVLAVWAAILLFRMVQIGRSYFYLRGVKQRATVSGIPLPLVPRRADLLISSDVVSPMAVGFLRPAVILPESLLTELSDPEREHVLLHEAAHLAAYDDWSNLAMRILGAALAIHPVAIWLLRRIEREREMACDDWVVARIGAARPYAASLARLFELRNTRRAEALASGIFGRHSQLGDRIEILLRRGRTFSARASASRVAASTLLLSGLLVAGAQAPRWIAFAQQQPRPSFDVASIKLNVSGASDVTFMPMSGGRLTVRNNPVTNLIGNAYGYRRYQILNGPGWVDTERFDIEARADGTAGKDQILRMLETLLEDRFKLKFHRETREFPVFALTAARGGIKLKPWREGNCVAVDPFNPSAWPPGEDRPHCGNNLVRAKGSNAEWRATKIDMAGVTGALGAIMRRPVIDKTGFNGTFDVDLEWTTDPDATDPSGPSIFTVLQEELGLKLESAKGPVEVLVIDHVERPDAN